MDTVMQIFAVVGIIVSILAVILFVAWAVSFYSSVAIKTFKYNLTEYCRVKNEHIEKKSQARRIRLAKAREQKIRQQEELQAIKLQTKQEIFELKKRELEMKETAKFEKAKLNAQNRTGMSFDDINHKINDTTSSREQTEQEQDKVQEETHSFVEQPLLTPAKDNIQYIESSEPVKSENAEEFIIIEEPDKLETSTIEQPTIVTEQPIIDTNIAEQPTTDTNIPEKTAIEPEIPVKKD